MADLKWSEAQWEKVSREVTEAFDKASVASACLPCYGPLPESADYVRDEKLLVGAPVTVDNDDSLKLFNLTVRVELSSEQVAEDGLSTAVLAFRRAANSLAQAEDHLVFNGHGPAQTTTNTALGSRSSIRPLSVGIPNILVSGPKELEGLVNPTTASEIVASITKRAPGGRSSLTPGPAEEQADGEHLVKEVAAAVVDLEGRSHPGPFACILGAQAFVAVHTPAVGMVLPADRITPVLNGPLLRSGQIPANVGIVVPTTGGSIDIVVATPPRVQFLQVTVAARYLFRVYEKFVWRIKDATAIHGLGI